MRKCLILVYLFASLSLSVEAKSHRSMKMKYMFMDTEVCPSTGALARKCPGYQVDHKKALCAGGDDLPNNMQYLSIKDHKLKTKKDLKVCYLMRRLK